MTLRQRLVRGLLAAALAAVAFGFGPSADIEAAESWTPSKALPSARITAGAAVAGDGHIYIFGGTDGNATLKETLTFDPTNPSAAWATRASLGTARRRFATAVGVDGRIYAIGGFGDSGALDSVEVYDPADDTWTAVQSLPARRMDAAAAAGLDGRIYLFGGHESTTGDALASVLIYDPTTDTWSDGPTMPHAGYQIAAVSGPDGRIYLIGGRGKLASSISNHVDVFDPGATDPIVAWSTAASLPASLAGVGAALGSDGRIYAVGGVGDGSDSKDLYAYRPSTDVWETLTPLSGTRSNHAAVATADSLYVIGGYSPSGAMTNHVDVYRFPPPPVEADTTPPQTTATLSGPSGSPGWYTDTVQVTLSATDAGSGVATTSYSLDGSPAQPYTGPLSIAGDGSHSLRFASTDHAGNAEPQHNVTIAIDATPPRVSGVPLEQPNAAGWYRDSVQVRFTCDDATSGIAHCADDVVIDGEGTALSAQGEASDNAGNRATATVDGIKIDRTPPRIAAGLITLDGSEAATNANGWYVEPVRLHVECADDLSSVSNCPADQSLSDGANQQFSLSVTDLAGNATELSLDNINIDTVAPTISVELTDATGQRVEPVPGSWLDGPVSVHVVCADATSGIATCSDDLTLESGANQEIDVAAVDRAGLRSELHLAGLNIGDPNVRISAALLDEAGQPIGPNAEGWFNEPVTVHFTCSGGVGEITECGPDATLGEGADQTAMGTVRDAAGNSATATADHLHLDLTAPTITAELRDGQGGPISAGTHGWYNQPVTVHFACADALSGVSSCTSDVVLGAGAGGSATGHAFDRAGNQNDLVVSGINVDTASPTMTVSYLGDDGNEVQPGADGWFVGPITIHVVCADDLSGIDECPDDQRIERGVSVHPTLHALDRAGNATDLTLDPITIVDPMPPEVVVNGPSGAAGWYTGQVTVELRASGEVSTTSSGEGSAFPGVSVSLDGGPFTPYSGPITISSDGIHTLNIGEPGAGATLAETQSLTIPIDATGPDVTCTPADNVWHAADIVRTCEARDATSGLAEDAARLRLTTNVPEGSETTDAETGSHTICDLAGNCTTVGPLGGNMVDKRAPRISLSALRATYLLHEHALITYACLDDGSGIAACDSTVASGGLLDTATLGTHSLTITARDAVGHLTKQTLSYQVGYALQPLYDQTKPVRKGSWATIQVQILDANGANQSSAKLAVHALDVSPLGQQPAAPGNLRRDFQYARTLGRTGGYQLLFNTATLSPGTYVLRLTVGSDPTVYTVQLVVR